MKKRLISALSSIPFIAALALSGDSSAAGCPYGMVNCPYPGQCGRYIDATGDGLCDLSQTTTTTSTDTAAADASDSSTQLNSDNSDVASNNLDPGNGSSDVNATADPGNDSNGGFFGDGDSYYILPISIILVLSYLLTYYLFQKGILKRNKHKRIWNLLLTAGYIGTSGTGLLLIVLINLGIRTALNPSLTFWHAELSILMVIGTLIHVHIYWKSFKHMFKVLFSFKPPSGGKISNPQITTKIRRKKTLEIFITRIKK